METAVLREQKNEERSQERAVAQAKMMALVTMKSHVGCSSKGENT